VLQRVGLALGLCSAACDHLGAGATEAASDEDVDELTLEASGGTLPADWPRQVPLYPDAQLGTTVRLARGWTLELDTGDSAARVIEFYRASLVDMDERASTDTGKSRVLNWVEEEPPMQVALSVAEEDRSEHTSVRLVVTREY